MYRRSIILISIVIIIFSAFCFRFTKGLVSDMSSTVFLDYLNAYQSSLPDNNVVIDFFVFTPALIIEIIRFRVKMKFLEYLFHLMILTLQGILVYSIILDGGSLWKTVLYGKNVPVFFIFIGTIMYGVSINIVYWKRQLYTGDNPVLYGYGNRRI